VVSESGASDGTKVHVATFDLLTPVLLLATFTIGFLIYCVLRAVGRAPEITGVKHNQLFGPFLAGFLIWLIGPVERLLLGRVSANVITAMSLPLCAVTGVCVAFGDLTAAVWLYAIAGLLDVVDGRLARLSGKQSVAGALLDSISDRWGEVMVFAGYMWLLHESPWLLAVIGAFGGSMMVSYTRARAEALGVSLSSGLMQRAERIVLVAVGSLIAAWFGEDPATVKYVEPIVGVTMLVCGAASIATAVNRWIVAYRVLARRAVDPVAPAAPALVAAPIRSSAVSSSEPPTERKAV
jgi:CDP-diacylglycerol--glycerol-3-phosphate 3-phosphatidyltransferase